jgi:hypothetical protein
VDESEDDERDAERDGDGLEDAAGGNVRSGLDGTSYQRSTKKLAGR